MKNILLLLCLFVATTTHSQVLLSENFNYTDSLTKNGWTPVSAWGTNGMFARATGMVHTGYVNSGIGNALTMAASGEDNKKDFTPTTKGSVYASFMLRVETIATLAGAYICGYTSGSTGSNYNLRFYLKRDSFDKSSFYLGVGRGTSAATYGTEKYGLGFESLITIKYTFDSTGTNNDIVSYYRHPSALTVTTEPTFIASNMGTGTGSDATELNAFFLRQGTASDSITLTIDGIRVGTTWASSVSQVSSVNTIEKSNFNVYPSITNGIINLSFDKIGTTANVSVINIQGQEVLTKKLPHTEGGQSLDLSPFPKGTYVIRLVSDNTILTQIVEKQ